MAGSRTVPRPRPGFTVHRFADSWCNAKNIEGKKGGFMIYVGGFPRFKKCCEEAVRNDYAGFVRA